MSVIVCWVVAIVYNLPRFFERATNHGNYVNIAQTDSNNMTSSPNSIDFSSPSVTSGSDSSVAVIGHPLVVRTPLHDHTVYIVVYRTGLFFIARFLIPFCALAFFNTRLIMAVRDSSRLPGRHWGSSASSSQSTRVNAILSTDGFAETRRLPSSWQHRRNRTVTSSPGARKERYTLTLVVVVIVFVVCELPDMFLRTWLALHSCLPAQVPFPKGVLMFVNGASNLCLTLNSSVNFLVYCFVGQRFRVLLVRMVCPVRQRLSPHSSPTTLLMMASDDTVTRKGAFKGVVGEVEGHGSGGPGGGARAGGSSESASRTYEYRHSRITVNLIK